MKVRFYLFSSLFLLFSAMISTSTYARFFQRDGFIRVFEQGRDEYINYINGNYKVLFMENFKLDAQKKIQIGECYLSSNRDVIISNDVMYSLRYARYWAHFLSYQDEGGAQLQFMCGREDISHHFGEDYNLALRNYTILKGRTCDSRLWLESPEGDNLKLECPINGANVIGFYEERKEKALATQLGEDAYLLRSVTRCETCSANEDF